ncbi:MAG: hypothetical protein QXM96_02470 [Candidatus Woesearchaeota archaeon]
MKGRPIFSQIRQNIIEILFYIEKGYGYDLYKIYCEIFPKVTQRVIYYHLKKGTEIGEIEIEKIEKEQGNYSWGNIAEKVYYKLGKNAKISNNEKVKEYFEKKINS